MVTKKFVADKDGIVEDILDNCALLLRPYFGTCRVIVFSEDIYLTRCKHGSCNCGLACLQPTDLHLQSVMIPREFVGRHITNTCILYIAIVRAHQRHVVF